MIQILGFIFICLILFLLGSLAYGIIKGIYDLIKDIFISLLIWMGDEELKKKTEQRKQKEFLEYDSYQG